MEYFKVNKNLFFLLLIMGSLSCQKDKIPMPNPSARIVLNSLLTTDSVLNVTISKSVTITDSNFVNVPITNAHVYFLRNNVFLDSLLYQYAEINNGSLYLPANYKSKKVYPISGGEYEILVKAPGFPDVTAKTTIPHLVKIESIDTTMLSSGDTSIFVRYNLLCNVIFTDPANEKNFYLFYVYLFPPLFGFNRGANLEFTCNDPIIEVKLNIGSTLQGIVFSDKAIHGQKHGFTIGLTGQDISCPPFVGPDYHWFNIHKSTLYFRLYSITEDYFKYLQTLTLFMQNVYNPLGLPTQVYSNVQGGFGIFSGAAVSSDSLTFNY